MGKNYFTKDGHFVSKNKYGAVVIDKKAFPLILQYRPTRRKDVNGNRIFVRVKTPIKHEDKAT